jgi:hypothetical protein
VNEAAKNVAEVQIERHDNAAVYARPLDQLGIASAFQPELPDVSRLVTEMLQKLDGLWRKSGIGQEAHASSAKRVQFILGQSSGIGQRLANIFLLKVR